MHRRPALLTFLRFDSVAAAVFACLFASLLLIADGYVLIVASRSVGVYLLLALEASTGLVGVIAVLNSYRTALDRIRRVARAGVYPAKEFGSLICLLVGAILLIIPGFVTDGVGIAVQIPPLRWAVGSVAQRVARARLEELYEYMQMDNT